MKPKHTPGPWEVHPHTGISVWKDDERIASIDINSDVKANACLIAEAPNMLAVLKEIKLIHLLECDGSSKRRTCKCHVLKIKDAIAKAEGRDR